MAAADNLVYNSYGEKYEVPRVRVSSIYELQKADHIAFHQLGAFWHHAIVEGIDIERGEIHVIEYTNTVKQFIRDNLWPPRITGIKIAKVVNTTYKFQNKVVYLMTHDRCLDPDDVVKRAQDRKDEEDYNPATLNCEHFAMWCKTGNSSSDQINKAKGMVLKEVKSKAGQEGVKTGVRHVAKEVVNQAASKAGQEAVKTGVREATEEIVTQAASKAGQEIVKTGTREATEEIVTQAASKAGEEIVKTGTREATEEILTQAVSNAGKDVVKTGARKGSEEVLTQSASKSAAGLGSSLVVGAVVSTVIEGAFVVKDIYCARKDMKKRTISKKEFKTAVKKRLITCTGNVGGSIVGSAIGQVVCPVPFVGGLVGGLVGGISGKLFGNVVASNLL